jgi:peptidoglycan hydrolase-like protein with peptidoglycan-binding domain
MRAGGAVLARRPALSAGLAAFGILFGGMSANAIYGQPGKHPQPLLATRGAAGAVATAQLGNDSRLMPVPLVEEVQSALASAGYYRATVDGKPGPATEAAVRAFQGAHGLTVDGAATPQLLAQLRQLATGEKLSPVPDPMAVASLEERMGRTSRPLVQDETTDMFEATRESSLATLSEDELVRRIQAGLNAAQVAELSADGIPGERTRAAIRTFEALEGLEVTGTPDPRILERLIEIGAIQ